MPSSRHGNKARLLPLRSESHRNERAERFVTDISVFRSGESFNLAYRAAIFTKLKTRFRVVFVDFRNCPPESENRLSPIFVSKPLKTSSEHFPKSNSYVRQCMNCTGLAYFFV